MRVTLAILLTLAAAPRAAGQPLMYTVHDLGGIPGGILGGKSIAEGINASGQVTGFAFDANSNSFAFRVAPGGQITDPGALLGTLGGSGSEGYRINASGQVCGLSYTAGDVGHPSFRTSPTGNLSTATVLGGGDAIAMNDAGQVAGFVTFPGNAGYHAVRTTPNGVFDAGSDLGTFGGTTSTATGINASGQVTGSALAGNGAQHAFRTTATGTLSTAEDLGASTVGYAINASGQVAGVSNGQAFRSSANGQPIHLEPLGAGGGGNGGFMGINALGVVVGSDNSNGGYVYDTQLHYLSSVVPAGWTIEFANDINDAGQIVGRGFFLGGPDHAVVLTPVPVPEPSGLALAGAAAIGGCLVRRRRSRLFRLQADRRA